MTRIEVVKLGGSLLEDPAMRAKALQAVASRVSRGGCLVLVHGGGKKIDAVLSRMGIPRRTHGGLRVTDEDTLEVVVGVLAGWVNKTLVGELRTMGVRCAGLSGADAGTLDAEVHPLVDGVDLGRVGRTVASDATLLHALLAARIVPVVASIAMESGSGALLNVNADAAASALAVSLGARRLVFLTDVDGLRDENGRVLRTIDPRRAMTLLDTDAVTGGMQPKLRACLEAVGGGVAEVLIAGPARHGSVLGSGRGGTRLVAA